MRETAIEFLRKQQQQEEEQQQQQEGEQQQQQQPHPKQPSNPARMPGLDERECKRLNSFKDVPDGKPRRCEDKETKRNKKRDKKLQQLQAQNN